MRVLAEAKEHFQKGLKLIDKAMEEEEQKDRTYNWSEIWPELTGKCSYKITKNGFEKLLKYQRMGVDARISRKYKSLYPYVEFIYMDDNITLQVPSKGDDIFDEQLLEEMKNFETL